ncbi:unnamed protein product [Oppiella nova]|uniref:GPI mannosyltransferase 2 n=1 Tax=Oppiella nova TaxID=334625 RepID=A0A7R9QRK4_9ACAR|nr:unnamed protein product [Oppiella nova]CAG2172382.1 unnamed protein product [Oppiella nova]
MPVLSDDLLAVMRVVAKSRLVILSLQLIANHLIPDHQSVDAFTNNLEANHVKTATDRVIYHALNGLNRWDSQYFTAIATSGYAREEWLAFFPLYPLLIRQLAATLMTIQVSLVGHNHLFVSHYCLILLTGFVVNFLAFVSASVVLYKLTIKLFANKSMAAECVQWFAYNPSSIFFSAYYSESLFAFLTFGGIYFTHASDNRLHLLWASVAFGLSSATRSNGLISIGFIVYTKLNHIINDCFMHRRFVLYSRLVIHVLQTLFYVLVCTLPFLYYQLYSWELFCDGVPNMPKWCMADILLPYTYIQKRYWNVGFLAYYEFKQIPNFLLALPVIALNLKTCLQYLLINKSRLMSLMAQQFHRQNREKYHSIMNNDKCFVHIVYVLAMTVFCILFVHIQVTTRMLMSATPLIYWAIESDEIKSHKRRTDFIHLWFYGYFIVGTILHSNFLPFT